MLERIQEGLYLEQTWGRNPSLICMGGGVASMLIHELRLRKSDGKVATYKDVHGSKLYGIEIKVIINKEADYLEFLEEVC